MISTHFLCCGRNLMNPQIFNQEQQSSTYKEYSKSDQNLPPKPKKSRIHKCHPWKLMDIDGINNTIQLCACEGYLMVVITFDRCTQHNKEVAWVYDLARCMWIVVELTFLPQLQIHGYMSLFGHLEKSKWALHQNMQEIAEQFKSF